MTGTTGNPVRVGTNPVTAIAATLFAAFAMFCAWHAYRPFVPAGLMTIWLTGTIAFLAFWVFADLRLILWQPAAQKRDKVWSFRGGSAKLHSGISGFSV